MKPCKENQQRNPKTNRCVKISPGPKTHKNKKVNHSTSSKSKSNHGLNKSKMNTTMLDNSIDKYAKFVANMQKSSIFKSHWTEMNYEVVNNTPDNDYQIQMVIDTFKAEFDNFFGFHPELVEPFYEHFRKYKPNKMFTDVMKWYKAYINKTGDKLSGAPTKITFDEKRAFLVYALLIEVNVNDYKTRIHGYFMG